MFGKLKYNIYLCRVIQFICIRQNQKSIAKLLIGNNFFSLTGTLYIVEERSFRLFLNISSVIAKGQKKEQLMETPFGSGNILKEKDFSCRGFFLFLSFILFFLFLFKVINLF